MFIGVISDTHGLLRPEALEALRGAQHIIHAGDIGAPEVLTALAQIAPVTAVRGNNDHGAWAARIPETAVFETEGVSIYVLHDLKELDLDPAASRSAPKARYATAIQRNSCIPALRAGAAGGFGVVVAGHSHQPSQDERNGVLFFNPGSAGPRRFRLPIAVGRLHVEDRAVRGELVALAVPTPSGY